MNKADTITGRLDEGRVTLENRPEPAPNDPVCGMEVRPEAAAAWSDFGGMRYYFCSEACQWKFDASPEQFVVPVHRPH